MVTIEHPADRAKNRSKKKGSDSLRHRVSIIVSIVLTALLFALIVFLFFPLPRITGAVLDVSDRLHGREPFPEGYRAAILAIAYVEVAVAGVAVALLFSMLLVILRGMVFHKTVIRLLLAVSLCCFLEALLFLPLGASVNLAFGVAAIALFIGVCLLVVRNVIAEALRIKQENDLTV